MLFVIPISLVGTRASAQSGGTPPAAATQAPPVDP